MRFLVAAMMVVFLLSGIVVLAVTLFELVRRILSCRRFERADGMIVGLERKTMTSRTGGGRMRTTVMHFPIIRFQTQAGEEVKFTSETGDSGERSRYQPGWKIAVLYDPHAEFKPMLDSWSGVWLPNLMGVLGGCGFLLGAFLIYIAFWDKIMGR